MSFLKIYIYILLTSLCNTSDDDGFPPPWGFFNSTRHVTWNEPRPECAHVLSFGRSKCTFFFSNIFFILYKCLFETGYDYHHTHDSQDNNRFYYLLQQVHDVEYNSIHFVIYFFWAINMIFQTFFCLILIFGTWMSFCDIFDIAFAPSGCLRTLFCVHFHTFYY